MKNILVSFSGGETSAYMSWIFKNEYKDKNLVFVFANTGQEREETLVFVKEVSREFDLNVVWIEAKVNPIKGKRTTYNEVNFKTACRDERLFVEMVKKYGLPNKCYPHCTRELKLQAITAFGKDYFNGEDYQNAVGIRADEYRRVSDYAQKEFGVIYPLVKKFIIKSDVKEFFKGRNIQLGLKEHQGNCKWCWKKSFNKLCRIWEENPEYFNVPWMLEKKYSLAGHNIDGTPRMLFRERKTTQDIIKMAEEKADNPNMYIDDGCNESCEFLPT